jgi:hypothetical protein
MKTPKSTATAKCFDDKLGLKVPDEFICPITMEVMEFPLMTRTGLNFDRDAILQWIKTNGSCPLTRKPMRPSDLVSNRKLHQDITKWRIQNGLTEEDDDETENSDDSFCLPSDYFTNRATHKQQQKSGSSRRSPFESELPSSSTENCGSNGSSQRSRRQEYPQRSAVFRKRNADRERTTRGVLRKTLTAALQLIHK